MKTSNNERNHLGLTKEQGSTILLALIFLELTFIAVCIGYQLFNPDLSKKETSFNLPRWEYAIDSIKDSRFIPEMNANGLNGWELVSARRALNSDSDEALYECIFKRQIRIN